MRFRLLSGYTSLTGYDEDGEENSHHSATNAKVLGGAVHLFSAAMRFAAFRVVVAFCLILLGGAIFAGHSMVSQNRSWTSVTRKLVLRCFISEQV